MISGCPLTFPEVALPTARESDARARARAPALAARDVARFEPENDVLCDFERILMVFMLKIVT